MAESHAEQKAVVVVRQAKENFVALNGIAEEEILAVTEKFKKWKSSLILTLLDTNTEVSRLKGPLASAQERKSVAEYDSYGTETHLQKYLSGFQWYQAVEALLQKRLRH